MKKFLISWILPVIISLGLFLIARPAFAQIVEPALALSDYLSQNSVSVGTENKDSYTQVYYIYNGQKFFITSASRNNRHVNTNGAYIAYVGDINEEGQIFLTNILTGSTIQLTYSGVNLEPKVNNSGQVVWESWLGDRRQMFLYDGASISQITQGDLATNADIEGDKIIYARQDVSGTWRAELYSINGKKKVDVTTGESAQNPKIKKGKILLADGTEEFPLTADDLLVLNLAPLTATDSAQTVTEQDILQELATPSSVNHEIPIATDSGTSN